MNILKITKYSEKALFSGAGKILVLKNIFWFFLAKKEKCPMFGQFSEKVHPTPNTKTEKWTHINFF